MSPIHPGFIALFSIFLFNCNNALFAYLVNVKHMPVLQVLAIQSISSFIFCAFYIAIKRTPYGLLCPPGTRAPIWSMALLSIIASILVTFSLQLLTLSEHVTVTCTLPFVTAFVAWLWLGEKFSRIQAACCVICILGVMLIADPLRIRSGTTPGQGSDGIPDTIPFKLLGIALTMIGICIIAPQFVLVRKIGEKATATQVSAASSLTLSIIAPILMIVSRTKFVLPAGTLEWLLLGLLNLIGITSDLSMIYAGQRTSPTTVTICAYAGVVFSNVIQWLLYGNHPSTTASIGMVVVLVAGIYGVVYGPIEAQVKVENSDPESRPLLEDRDADLEPDAGTYHGV